MVLGGIPDTQVLSTKWQGMHYPQDIHTTPKSNLFDYELTTNESERGTGKIFVDRGDVCYCPLSGSPIRCHTDPRITKLPFEQ